MELRLNPMSKTFREAIRLFSEFFNPDLCLLYFPVCGQSVFVFSALKWSMIECYNLLISVFIFYRKIEGKNLTKLILKKGYTVQTYVWKRKNLIRLQLQES